MPDFTKKPTENTAYSLGESEYRFACLVWEHEPLGSGALVKAAAEALGWKKSTTYTVLKNLIAKGILENNASVVSSKIPKTAVQRAESTAVVTRTFDGSLPQFVAAFLGERSITPDEAAEIEALIAHYKGGASSC